PEPTAAAAAAPRPAWCAPRARARPRAAACEPSATPALSRPSSDLLRVDLVLVMTARRRKTHRAPGGTKKSAHRHLGGGGGTLARSPRGAGAPRLRSGCPRRAKGRSRPDRL